MMVVYKSPMMIVIIVNGLPCNTIKASEMLVAPRISECFGLLNDQAYIA